MAKTACEEAAELLDGYADDDDQYNYPDVAAEERQIAKRLRAEAKDLKRLRRLIVRVHANSDAYGTLKSEVRQEVMREYARIQKEQK